MTVPQVIGVFLQYFKSKYLLHSHFKCTTGFKSKYRSDIKILMNIKMIMFIQDSVRMESQANPRAFPKRKW